MSEFKLEEGQRVVLRCGMTATVAPQYVQYQTLARTFPWVLRIDNYKRVDITDLGRFYPGVCSVDSPFDVVKVVREINGNERIDKEYVRIGNRVKIVAPKYYTLGRISSVREPSRDRNEQLSFDVRFDQEISVKTDKDHSISHRDFTFGIDGRMKHFYRFGTTDPIIFKAEEDGVVFDFFNKKFTCGERS